MSDEVVQRHRTVLARIRFLTREQRRDPTRAEAMLWRDLRDRDVGNGKFRRQVPIGPYVADFVCLEARLIVELDGAPHADPEQQDHDRVRDAWLRGQGFRVLRFSNDLILSGSGELVLAEIRRALQKSEDPSSVAPPGRHLLPQGEKERRAPPSSLVGEGGPRVSEGRMRGHLRS